MGGEGEGGERRLGYAKKTFYAKCSFPLRASWKVNCDVNVVAIYACKLSSGSEKILTPLERKLKKIFQHEG